jgi:hypothetical protein
MRSAYCTLHGLLTAFDSEFDLDQHIESNDSLSCFALFRKMGKCNMMEFITYASALVAAASVGGIVITLFMIAIKDTGD